MRAHAGLLYALVTVLAIATLYGATYQQFRYFTLAAPGGASDAVEYVRIARGDPGVDRAGPHQYRWITPVLARGILPIAGRLVAGPDQAVTLSFYLVNFAFSTVTCLILFALLRAMAFSVPFALLGVAMFASSRATVLVTATPMADAVYYLAVVTLLALIVTRRTLLLMLLLPVLALTKETILPFLLLPLLTDLRRVRIYWVALAAALLAHTISGQAIDAMFASQGHSLVRDLREHVPEVWANLAGLFTVAGLHDLQGGFSLLLPLAGMGAWVNARHRYHAVPAVVVVAIPLAFGLALLSGNLGRMFFAAFPAVIAYALIAVEHVVREVESR